MRSHRLSVFSAAAVAVVAALLPLGAEASPESITAAADAFVNEAKPKLNYGSASSLSLDASPAKRAYLLFDVPAGDPILQATLSLYVKRASQAFDLRLVTSAWGERTITAGNAPPVGDVVASSGLVARDTWVSIDVTSFAAAGMPLNLALTVPGGEQVVASRESAKPPRLVVERAVSTTTTTTTTGPPLPPPPVTGGIWISDSELAALPVVGPAWENVWAAATSEWGGADLADNNSNHDMLVFAGALVANRTGDAAMRAKVIAGIESLRDSRLARVLELARNLPGYVLAADVVHLAEVDPATDQWFRPFVAGLRTAPLEGHSGGQNLRETAMFAANNWGSRSRQAMVAVDLYLGDTADLQDILTAQRGYLGEPVSHQLRFTDTDWHADPANKAGINHRGATIDGHDVDGVIPEDQRRTGPFKWPPPQGDYPWGCIQGEAASAAMLHRAGLMDFRAGDDAIARAANWLFNVNGNPATGDDTPTPWIINRYAATTFPTATPTAIGKSIAWTDWTHPPA